MSKARIRKGLPTPLPVPSVEGPYGKSSVIYKFTGFDFLDDPSNMPTAEAILNRSNRFFGMDPEDFAGSFRAGRDAFLRAKNDFNTSSFYGINRYVPSYRQTYYGWNEANLRSWTPDGKYEPRPMPNWLAKDPLNFSNPVTTDFAMRFTMSYEDASRYANFQNYGFGSPFTDTQEDKYELKTFEHSTITSPGGTSISERYDMPQYDFPSVVLPNGDLLFYAYNPINDLVSNESFYGLCIQNSITGEISSFSVKRADGTAAWFIEPGLNESRDMSLFVVNDTIFLSFNNTYGSYQTDSLMSEGGIDLNSRLFKISLDGTVDEEFFPTVLRANRLLSIKQQLVNDKYEQKRDKGEEMAAMQFDLDQIATSNGDGTYTATEEANQSQVDGLVMTIESLTVQYNALGLEEAALAADYQALYDQFSADGTLSGDISQFQKFNSLVNVYHFPGVTGTTGASATAGSYYLAFDKLDEYGPLDAENNEYWQPISIGLLKIDEDGSNPVAIFKEDVIFCPRTATDGQGDPYEFNLGNVKKSLLLSSGDFLLFTVETDQDGYHYGYNPKFVKVSKTGIVDLSFTIDGYADSLYENALSQSPAEDYSRLKVVVPNGYFHDLFNGGMIEGLPVNGMIELENGKVLIYGGFANIMTDRPIGSQNYGDAIHNIYDVGCFAVLNSDGSLDTTFNNTSEMSSYLYPVVTNAPAPWDNGETVRPQKQYIAPVGFQYASDNSKNGGSMAIKFAKIIDNKLYVNLSREGLVSYNRTHLLDGSKLYRINLNDLTLDETCDFRSFNNVSDIISIGNGYRVYVAGKLSGDRNAYNHRWTYASADDYELSSMNHFISHRLYNMKWDKGLGGYMMESSRDSVGQIVRDWNSVGDQIVSSTRGFFIFNVDEVNKSEISFHVYNENVQHNESVAYYSGHTPLQKNDFGSISWDTAYMGPYNKSEDVETVSRFYRGLELNENDLDKYDAYKTNFRMKYTSEDLWFDLSSHKMEAIDGEFVGYTPFALGNGLNDGEYSISEYLPEFPNHIPAVPNLNMLKGYTASQGDITRVMEIGDEYIYLNGKWVNYYSTLLEDLYTSVRGIRDAKIKSLNEIILSLKPFTYAAYHIPKANLSEYIQSL